MTSRSRSAPSRTHALVRGFETAAPAYERGRPEYPAAVFRHFRRVFGLGPGTTTVELGAGTGKFTRGLRTTRTTIVAIEPTAGMRRVFRRVLPDVVILDGTAEEIPVPDGLADAVLVAQAFHWFNARKALKEIARVLRPGGGLGLVWNTRDRSVPWVRELSGILESVPHRDPRAHWRPTLARSKEFSPLERKEFSFVQQLRRTEFADRVRSISYVAVASSAEQARVLHAAEELLDRTPGVRGRDVVPLPYRTDAHWTFRR